MLLLSRVTGIVQFTNTDEFIPRLTRISEGQLMNTGGTTSAGGNGVKSDTNIINQNNKAGHGKLFKEGGKGGEGGGTNHASR